MNIRSILLVLLFVVASKLSAVEFRSLSAEEVSESFSLVGVISESSSYKNKRGEQGGIAVIRNKSNNKTVTIKVGSQLAFNLDYVVTDIKRNRISVSNGSVEAHIAYNGSTIEKDSGPSPEEVSQRRRERFQKYYEDYKKMLEEVNEVQTNSDSDTEVGSSDFIGVSKPDWSEGKTIKEPLENGKVLDPSYYVEDLPENEDFESGNSEGGYVKLSDYYDLEQISNEGHQVDDYRELENVEQHNIVNEQNEFEVVY